MVSLWRRARSRRSRLAALLLAIAALPGVALATEPGGEPIGSFEPPLPASARGRIVTEPRPSVMPAVTGRHIAMLSHRLPEDRRAGPGYGTDYAFGTRTSAFPTLLVDWRPTERLSLTAGRELGSSTGPGVYGTWSINRISDVTLGFRFERTRMRLAPQPGYYDVDGTTGVSQSVPAFAALRVGSPTAFVAVAAGAEMRRRLRVEDTRGGSLAERTDEPTPFVAVAGRILF